MIRVLVLADVPGWAWDRKALAYQRHLDGDEFRVTVAYHSTCPSLHHFDLVHLFEVSQIGIAAGHAQRPFKLIAGLTANVWRTWGWERMHKWAAQVDALHANSLLLYKDLKQFHANTFYTPNGVDADFWHRTIPYPPDHPVIFGHVGKPNPRKGAALILEAARKVGAVLRLVQRTAKLAQSAEDMRNWYQGISVQVTASNMDGTPNPMLEAAACECALLSTPIGNMPQFITPENGFLTTNTLPYHGPEPVDAETLALDSKQIDRLRDEFADRMAWFLTHPAETIEMGRAARQRVLAEWSWELQVRYVEYMWREVIRG